jgi:hypothetical protein
MVFQFLPVKSFSVRQTFISLLIRLADKFKVGSSRCDDRTAQRAIPTK